MRALSASTQIVGVAYFMFFLIFSVVFLVISAYVPFDFPHFLMFSYWHPLFVALWSDLREIVVIRAVTPFVVSMWRESHHTRSRGVAHKGKEEEMNEREGKRAIYLLPPCPEIK